MKAEFWSAVEQAYFQVLELAPEARTAFLDKNYSSRLDIRHEVESLLAHKDAAENLTPVSVFDVAKKAFEDVEFDSPIGKLVDNKYRIVSCIGSGGFADVYLARHVVLHTPLALKTPKRRFRDDTEYCQKFKAEAQRAAVLRHENIVRLYDVVVEDDDIFAVMDYIEGETLEKRLTKLKRPLTMDEFFPIAIKCAAALGAAHKERIVHLDVKPANIMLMNDEQVKVCDFGIARRLPSVLPNDTTEISGDQWQLAGTPAYMAPEVIFGARFDERADLFSLGVVFYEMLAGYNPFNAGAADPTFNRIRHDTPPLISKRNPKIDSRLEDLVFTLLNKEPEQRITSAADLLAQLNATRHSLNRPGYLVQSIREAFGESRIAQVAALLIVFSALSAPVAWVYRTELRRALGFANFVDPAGSSVKTPVVLLGDIENLTGNPAFDFTASQLLSVAMDQSQYLNVLSRFRVSEALGRSGRSPSERLTPALLVDLAKNEGADYAIDGELVNRAGASEIVLRVTPLASGKNGKELRASVAGPEQLPATVGKLSAELRAWLGESPSQINATNVQLEQVTTRSAAAWERFSRAVRMEALGRFEDEVNLLQSAVEIDPEFASAHALLGIQQNNLGNMEAGLSNVTRAYAMRSRATERESYKIAGMFHTLRYEFEKATDAFRTLTNLHPFDEIGQRYFAQSLANQLLINESIQAARRALDLNPRSLINIGTLSTVLLQAGRDDEALSVIETSQPAGQLVSPTLAQFQGEARLGQDDFQKAEESFRRLISAGGNWENTGHHALAATHIMEGRLNDAVAQLESSLALSQRSKNMRLWFKLHNWVAWIYSLENRPGLARTHALAIAEEPASPANLRDLRGIALVMVDAGEFTIAERFMRTVETFTQSYESNCHLGALAQLRGEMARKRRDYATARREFETAIKLWPDALTLWSTGRFFLEVGEFERAQGLYHQILSRKGEIIRWHFPGLFALAQLGKARTESKLLNKAQAMKDYDSFLATFGRFSSQLDFVKTAQSERDHLARAVHE